MTKLFVACILAVLIGTLLPLSSVANAAPQKYSDRILHVKLREGTSLTFDGTRFAGTAAASLYAKLGTKTPKVQRLFGSKPSLDSRYESMRAQGHDVARLSQYVRIDLGRITDTARVAAELKQLPGVEEAYPKPLPTPLPASPNLASLQGYRAAAPGGIGANSRTTWPGSQGTGVKVVDIEYSWNTNHEDLAKARAAGAVIRVNTPLDPFSDNSHGTGVLGILNAQNNGYGVTGLVPDASIGMANANSAEMGWDPAGAIYAASAVMKSGDVMVIEMQAWGPSSEPNSFVPLEWVPEVYDAIRYATAKNIMVVEAAGNGSQNLGNTALYGSPFPMGKPSSGAFIVGAGDACAGGAPSRSRLAYSNYGPRVDFQGWGNCVATTGWNGDAYNGGVNAMYTKNFEGTSAATPIVAGAVTSYVAAYKKLNGTAPSIANVRSSLKSTGTPQSAAAGSLSGTIGPLPNLGKALLLTDKKAPTAPTGVKAKLSSRNKPVLTWRASTDNVKVTGYKLYRNGVYLKTLPVGTTYTDTTTSSKKKYTYKLRAVDASGNQSAYSSSVSITTK